ncbi:MAG: hypothetical protein KatS3mg102_2198 [Planctomycetota bacterium]|nr:MAG: hypothetical protein KatS3mg102_2198 [Planctomycetota bacterium]
MPRCQRCATVLEYRLSEQWFVRMKPLAQPAIEVVRQGRIRFHPERWTGVYLHWMENIRDWCISRQLWWGHRIPVWYCGTCKGQTVSRQPPSACAHCGATEGLEQDPDVLDTWFSSWLWPFSTLGWPEDTPALRTFYPTRTLVTGHEIIFFWVARMVMAGLFCMREIPFSDVVIHGIIRDERGRKMSKSLGNGVDPLEVIEETSADALRFTLVYLTPEGQDARISKQKFELGRNFCTKLWNAARLVLSNLEGYRWRPGLPEQLEPEDRWIVSRLHAATAGARAALDAFRFHAYLQSLYDFVWGEFCDWWLEIVKPRWYEGGPEVRERAQQVAVYVLERVLRLLHPVVPFVTEEIWGRLREAVQAESWQPLLATAPFPEAEPERIDPELEERFALLTTLVRELRNIRAEHQIPPGRAIAAMVTTARAPAGAESTAPSASLRLVEQGRALLQRLARLERLEIAPGLERPRGAATAAVKDLEVHVPLEGVIDLEAERRRLESRQNKLAAQLGAARNKLSQPSFVERAPAEVVERTRALVRDLEQELRALEASLAEMGQPQQRS